MTIPTAIKPRPGCRPCFERGRQHEQARHRERLVDPAWSKNLACAEAPYTGTGRSHVWPVAVYGTGPHRESANLCAATSPPAFGKNCNACCKHFPLFTLRATTPG